MTDTTIQNGSVVTSPDSILDTVKKMIGFESEYTDFDLDLVVHINTAFLTLQQLGVGPTNGFMITSKADTWGSFLGVDPNLNAVKTYIAQRVRLLFDPPTTSFAIDAIKESLKEIEWRLNVHADKEVPTSGEPVDG